MSGLYTFGRCELRPVERQLLIDGTPAPLGARAFDLLVTLVERRDRVVAKGELFDTVWPGLVVEENNLQVQVSSLRKLLGSNAIATVPGRGYQFVAALDANGGNENGVRAEVPSPPNNLPHARTRFIGRETALSDCANMLRETRLLTLSGIGGCGKTRLAQELAQREFGAFRDGAWFVDLSPLQDAQQVSAAVATTIGVQTGHLTDHLKARRTLVVMDNCEHVIDGAVKSIEMLLEACGALKIIATSREVLGTAGEQVFAVRSLSLPATGDLEEVRRSEAVRLFIDHARLVVPDFDVDGHNAAAIVEICRRLDGIPLAIELAAARVRVLPVDEIRARLDDRFRLLTGAHRSLPRHQTLHATMQWSHDLLTSRERELFRRLAVFAGGCTLAAATRVTGDGADEYDVLECLTALHDKSLVLVDRDTQAQPRYRMLETVRQYAEERLNEAGESDEVRTLHLLHYVALAEKAAPELQSGPMVTTWLATWTLEQQNLLAAHAWCAHAPGGGDLAIRLIAALWRYWIAKQHARGHLLAQAALAIAGAEPDSVHRCKTLHVMAFCAVRLGAFEDALASGDRCLEMSRRIGAVKEIIAGLCITACALHAIGRRDDALIRYNEASDLARATHDRNLSKALSGIGEVHRDSGNLAAAETLYRESIDVSLSFDDPFGANITLLNLARVLISTGRVEEARAALVEAQARGDGSGAPCLMDVVAALAAALGDYETAARFHGALLRQMQEHDLRYEPVDERFITMWMAHARAGIGDTAFDAAQEAGRVLALDAGIAEVDRWLGAAR